MCRDKETSLSHDGQQSDGFEGRCLAPGIGAAYNHNLLVLVQDYIDGDGFFLSGHRNKGVYGMFDLKRAAEVEFGPYTVVFGTEKRYRVEEIDFLEYLKILR